MKSLIIALSVSFFSPFDATPGKEPVFVCRACEKEFAECASCGHGPEKHGKLNHAPLCPCGGFGTKK